MAPPKVETITIRVTSPDFQGEHLDQAQFVLQGMHNRLGISHWKYGSIHDSFPHHRVGVDNCEQRIQKYKETGNTEWLMDAMNYLYIEILCPSVRGAHFRATDSDESPGAVNVDGSVSHGKVGE